MHTGLKIKELRNLKLWTQAQLAEISGVSERTVRRLEATGKAESATLLSILMALDTNLEELENTYNQDETIKKESEEKYVESGFLRRIESGRELVRIIGNAHQYGYDYHDCNTEVQIEMAQRFLSGIADYLDIWDMLEIGQKFNSEHEISKYMKDLEEHGLWVFGNRQVNSNNLITAIIEIYSKHNPMIHKIKLDGKVVQK